MELEFTTSASLSIDCMDVQFDWDKSRDDKKNAPTKHSISWGKQFDVSPSKIVLLKHKSKD
jgi:hypothetical protein